jgi:hypothetical protein
MPLPSPQTDADTDALHAAAQTEVPNRTGETNTGETNTGETNTGEMRAHAEAAATGRDKDLRDLQPTTPTAAPSPAPSPAPSTPLPAGARTLWFGDLDMRDVALVGGKNASLGELTRASKALGFRVTEGVAITANAFRWYLE